MALIRLGVDANREIVHVNPANVTSVLECGPSSIEVRFVGGDRGRFTFHDTAARNRVIDALSRHGEPTP